MEIPGENKENGPERIFRATMSKGFLNLRRQMDIEIHEAQQTPNRLDQNKATPRHITSTLSKVSKIKEGSYI